MSDTDIGCKLCGVGAGSHTSGTHQYIDPNNHGALNEILKSAKDPKPKETASNARPQVEIRKGLPPDHGLRLALMRAGVITLDQLQQADKEILDAQQSGGGVVFIAPEVELDPTNRSAPSSTTEPSVVSDSGMGDRGSAQGSLWPSS